MTALADLRVLDLSGHVAGPFCAKLFGDFGADVIKVEPPGGEAGRALLPFIDDEPGLERSAFFLYLNANKRGITLDVTIEDGVDVLRTLVRDADVVVESFAPGMMDALGLGFDALEAIRPGIILTSITPFGQTGPWRDLPGDDLIAAACSGWASINGWPERAPLKPSGYQASFQAGLAAFDATMAAVLERDRGGVGQHVDVSLLEPSVASFAPALLHLQYRGVVMNRQHGDFSRGPVPTTDGHFSLTLSRAHFWRDAMNELGLPDLAHDERFYEASYRQEHHHEVAPQIEQRLAARGKRELFTKLGDLRVVGGMVLTTEELFTDPQVQAREFLQRIDRPGTGPLAYPGAPFKMSATPWALTRPAPHLGEHTDDVLASAGISPQRVAELRAVGVV